MKRLAIVPAFVCEWASVALDFGAAIAFACAEYFYNLSATKRDLEQIHEDRF